jgi:hypothetical protein
MTMSEAFRTYGVTLGSPRWSWSGQADDGRVVLALWSDRFSRKTQPITYDGSIDASEQVINKNGRNERARYLKTVWDSPDRLFDVVMVVKKDGPADAPHRVADAFPRPNMRMRLIDLNDDGAFFAEMVGMPAPGQDAAKKALPHERFYKRGKGVAT